MDWLGDDCMGLHIFWRFFEGAAFSISCWAPAQCTPTLACWCAPPGALASRTHLRAQKALHGTPISSSWIQT